MRPDDIVTCTFCGSEHVLAGLRLVPEGAAELMVLLEHRADVHGAVRARLCADCRRLDLHVEHAHELWQQAQGDR